MSIIVWWSSNRICYYFVMCFIYMCIRVFNFVNCKNKPDPWRNLQNKEYGLIKLK
ncbi:hypothetical protein Hanom_Chr06g00487541 [Helianthus anomalus]